MRYERSCNLLYRKILGKAAKPYGLTQSECDILLFINNNPKYNTATDIVTNRGIAKSNVSTSIDSLKIKDYLTTQIDENNRRIVRLYLNDLALPIIKDLLQAQESFKNIITKNISNEELEAYFALMTRSHKNITLALSELEKEG